MVQLELSQCGPKQANFEVLARLADGVLLLFLLLGLVVGFWL